MLGALWLLLTRTRWGTLVRAATQDREMVGALGVNQALALHRGVRARRLARGRWAARCRLPREPANLDMDLDAIGEAFVVVVVGGMGSIPGAFVAALLIARSRRSASALGPVDVFGIAVSVLASSRWSPSSW